MIKDSKPTDIERKLRKTVGVIGGGQLGMMMGESVKSLGIDIHILDSHTNPPAKKISTKHILGGVKNAEKIIELSQSVDFLTFETELANADALTELKKKGVTVNPLPETLLIIKDKLAQKIFLDKNDVLVGEFSEINDEGEAKKFGEKFGYPFLLKARFDSYDGRGNAVVTSENDIIESIEKLGGRKLYAEKFVKFTKELAIIAVRSMDGTIKTYTPVETLQENNICHKVLCPAQISSEITEKCQKIAVQVLQLFGGAGAFGIEMFLTEGGEIMINEISPRVHNSGHHTIEACETSQFENHIRAISGLPLGSTEMKLPFAVMLNILGDKHTVSLPKGTEKAEQIKGVSLHWYNKEEVRLERKMGHITAVAETMEAAEENAQKALECISF